MDDKPTRKRGRGVGPRLNDLQRLEIIHKHKHSKPPISLRQLARDFGVDEKSIRRMVNAAADIEARASASSVLNMRAQVHRRPTPRFPELEKTLAAWIDAKERAKAEISPSIVIDKAKLIARATGISPDDFKASWGWYDKFSKRYGIRTAFVGSRNVKSDEVRRDTHRKTKSLQELHSLMTRYDPQWVFTVEETSLFYDALPFDADISIEVNRNRVTLVVCCNSTGRLTLPVCMVGKEGLDGAGINFPLPYLMQERAWLDRPTFGSWYSSVFVPYVRERTSNPVLLVVDGERPGHQGDFEEDGVRLVFLPPPLSVPQTSVETVDAVMTMNPKMWWSRPLGMGVIPALKAKYKYLLVQSVLSYHNAPEEVKAELKAAEESNHGGGVHFGHPPTLLDAARLLEQAWSQVPGDLLEHCFARANLAPPSKLFVPPAPPTGMNALEEQNQASIRYNDAIAAKIEEMLVSSSLLVTTWTTSEQHPVILKERIRTFMYLDDDNSFGLQRQVQEEINKALSDQAPSASRSESTVSAPGAGVPDRDPDEASSEKPALECQIRGLLLGITEIASRLRLLPRAGADAKKLAPLQLEGCIAAADQIRHCIQAFDNTLHKESNLEVKLPSTKNPAEMPAVDQAQGGNINFV